MPATKIETGVHIELKRLRLTPIARKHRPEKTASLARSLKDLNQQLEEIIVCPQDEAAGQASPLFDVLAGVGRKEAEESLGWEKGRCTIMYGLSLYEKLKVTLDENEERQANSPLDDARIYQGMIKAEPGLTQEKLAERLGMKQNTLSEYLSVMTKLTPKILESIGQPINLRLAHILQLCRLKTPEDQISLAKEASQKDLSVKELKAFVDKKLKGENPTPEPAKDPAGASPFKFSRKGIQVKMDTAFETTGGLDYFLAELRIAYLAWAAKDGKHAADAAGKAESAEKSDSAVTAESEVSVESASSAEYGVPSPLQVKATFHPDIRQVILEWTPVPEARYEVDYTYQPDAPYQPVPGRDALSEPRTEIHATHPDKKEAWFKVKAHVEGACVISDPVRVALE